MKTNSPRSTVGSSPRRTGARRALRFRRSSNMRIGRLAGLASEALTPTRNVWDGRGREATLLHIPSPCHTLRWSHVFLFRHHRETSCSVGYQLALLNSNFRPVCSFANSLDLVRPTRDRRDPLLMLTTSRIGLFALCLPLRRLLVPGRGSNGGGHIAQDPSSPSSPSASNGGRNKRHLHLPLPCARPALRRAGQNAVAPAPAQAAPNVSRIPGDPETFAQTDAAATSEVAQNVWVHIDCKRYALSGRRCPTSPPL